VCEHIKLCNTEFLENQGRGLRIGDQEKRKKNEEKRKKTEFRRKKARSSDKILPSFNIHVFAQGIYYKWAFIQGRES